MIILTNQKKNYGLRYVSNSTTNNVLTLKKKRNKLRGPYGSNMYSKLPFIGTSTMSNPLNLILLAFFLGYFFISLGVIGYFIKTNLALELELQNTVNVLKKTTEALNFQETTLKTLSNRLFLLENSFSYKIGTWVSKDNLTLGTQIIGGTGVVLGVIYLVTGVNLWALGCEKILSNLNHSLKVLFPDHYTVKKYKFVDQDNNALAVIENVNSTSEFWITKKNETEPSTLNLSFFSENTDQIRVLQEEATSLLNAEVGYLNTISALTNEINDLTSKISELTLDIEMLTANHADSIADAAKVAGEIGKSVF